MTRGAAKVLTLNRQPLESKLSTAAYDPQERYPVLAIPQRRCVSVFDFPAAHYQPLVEAESRGLAHIRTNSGPSGSQDSGRRKAEVRTLPAHLVPGSSIHSYKIFLAEILGGFLS
jgi:hypothetical protein